MVTDIDGEGKSAGVLMMIGMRKSQRRPMPSRITICEPVPCQGHFQAHGGADERARTRLFWATVGVVIIGIGLPILIGLALLPRLIQPLKR
jgi:hypothetical protein